MLNVLERVWRVDAEANKNDVGFRVGQRPQTFVVFLPGRIPQRKLYGAAIDLAICDIVFKDGRYVVGWEVSEREDTEEGSLATGSVTNDD